MVALPNIQLQEQRKIFPFEAWTQPVWTYEDLVSITMAFTELIVQ